MIEPRIRVVRGGPLLVDGPVRMVRLKKVDRGPEEKPSWRPGRPLAAAGPYAVCRCGASRAKPFCDRAPDGSCFAEAVTGAGPLPVTWSIDDLSGPALALKPNGPARLLGPVSIVDGSGNPYPAVERCSLCRCGHSGAMPFCDGTHKVIGFRG